MSKIDSNDISNQDKPKESCQLFSVDHDRGKCYNLPHDLEEEKRVIFEDKLIVQLSPPFEASFFDKIEEQEDFASKDEWTLRFDKLGITIAIQEKTIPIDINAYMEPVLKQLQEKRKQLYEGTRELGRDLNSKKTRRIYALTAAQNAITASRTEDRLSAQENHRLESAAQDIIEVDAKTEETQFSTKPLSKGVHPVPTTKPPFKEYRTSSSLLVKDTQSNVATTNQLGQVDGFYSDIMIVENQLRIRLTECSLVDKDIKMLEDNKAKHNTHVYRFKAGQIVPDKAKDLIHCYYGNTFKKCEKCPSKENCDTLESHRFFDVFSYYTKNMLSLSDTVKHAEKDFGIDFDDPMKMIDRHAPITFEYDEEKYKVWDFKNEIGKTFMLVQYIVSDESITTLPGVRMTADIPAETDLFLPSLPLLPAKLLNIPDIWNKPKHEVFFTDCLEFTHYAETREDKKIITSYYGGQFGDIEVDFFFLRNRTVHYLIFEYPGVSLEDAIKKACHNYRQMNKESNVKVDFYFLKPQMINDSTLDGFALKDKLTSEEFSAQYMNDENAEPSKSDRSASSNDRSIKEIKKLKMLLWPLIPQSKYILMAGAKHSGKTTLAVSIAASVASGNNIVQILRSEEKETGVLLLNMEFPEDEYLDHVEPIINTISKKPLRNIPLKIKHMAGEAIVIHSKDGMNKIKEMVSPYKDEIKMLIIDNITAVSEGGPQENTGWLKYTYPYICELNKMGITVIVIAHWDNNDIVGGKQKLRNARDCIVIKRTNPRDEKDIICASVNKPYDTSNYQHHNMTMKLTLDMYAESPKWEFDDQYLKDILLSKDSTEKLANYFNTTDTTIRRWWKKQFPGTQRKDRNK